jgi:hypothetical protein
MSLVGSFELNNKKRSNSPHQIPSRPLPFGGIKERPPGRGKLTPVRLLLMTLFPTVPGESSNHRLLPKIRSHGPLSGSKLLWGSSAVKDYKLASWETNEY